MFGKNLKRIMTEKRISYAALSKSTGFGKATISQWVNGAFTPTPERMAVIAGALGCTVEELTGSPVQALIDSTGPKTTLTCKEAAMLMHKHESYIRRGLQEGRPGFEFGSAVKTSGKWSYFIGAAKFTEVTGIPVAEV